MRKFYTLAAVALMALSASAQDRSAEFKGIETKGPVLARSAVRYTAPFAAPKPEKVKSAMEYNGDYFWSFYRHTGQLVSPKQINIVVTDASTGSAIINNLWDRAPIPATIDAEAGTMTIPNKVLLMNLNGEDIYFYLKEFNADHTGVLPGASSAANVVGTIDEEKVVTFPSDVIFTVGNPDDERQGWYLATSQNVFTMQEDPSNEGWKRIGMATLQDGWLTPAFGVNQADYTYEVEIQQNEEYDTIYRLVDPYRGNFPFAKFNESTVTHGYIVFDIYYPDNVYFQIEEAGFAITDPSITITHFYCYNLTTFFMQRYDKSPLEVKEEMGSDMHYTTYDPETRVLTIPSYYDPDGKLVNETMWGDQTQQGSGWEEEDGSPTNMETKIYFPGSPLIGSVESLGTDNSPVRYYNLQGVEVANPSAGIFIRKQGGKVTKEIIR